jgi:hypothetical protein
MKVSRTFFAAAFLSFMFLGLFVLGIPVSGFANEPHVCINGAIATNNQNLGSTAQISWAYNGACGHSSTTYWWKFKVINGNSPFNTICSADNNGAGYYIPPDVELHTLTTPANCPNGIPRGSTVKLKATVTYQAVGTGVMTFTDNLTNY